MTTTDFTVSRPGHSRPATGIALVRMLTNWRRRSRANRTVGTLHGLSDLQLKDIGVRRAEIDRLFRP
jgi:uncharacterized protein YjiS (DUF1127 family)